MVRFDSFHWKEKLFKFFIPQNAAQFVVTWVIVLGLNIGIRLYTILPIIDNLTPIKGEITDLKIGTAGGGSIRYGGASNTYYFKLDDHPATFFIDDIGLFKFGVHKEIFNEGNIIETLISEPERLNKVTEISPRNNLPDEDEAIQIYGVSFNGQQEISVFGCLTDKAYRANIIVLVPLFIYLFIYCF